MDTKKLAYFLRLHENGNITHTAKEAFLTQSALTKMIQGWEEEFHCKLLTRSRKGVRFTREGELFVTLCQQVLALEKTFREDVSSAADAYAAAQRGLRVAIFERSYTPVGASVRNFGHGLILGQAPGKMLDLAKNSREIWATMAKQAKFLTRQKGTYLLARTQSEQAVLEAFVDGRLSASCEFAINCADLNDVIVFPEPVS